ncbi:hypothetical protein C8Q74DRAFT_1292868, partial [Fomes fomentarius]
MALALLRLHPIALRFGPSTTGGSSDAALGLPELFSEVRDPERLDNLLAPGSRRSQTSRPPVVAKIKSVPEEGPVLNVEQVFALWSAAIKAAKALDDQPLTKQPPTLPQHTQVLSDTCPSTPLPAKSLSTTPTL